MRRHPGPVRVLASLLVTALLHGAFGPAAWAQVVAVGAAPAPIGGSAAAAGGSFAGASRSATPAPLSLSLPTAGLGRVLPAPAVSISPAAALKGGAASAAAASVPARAAERPSAAARALGVALIPGALRERERAFAKPGPAAAQGRAALNEEAFEPEARPTPISKRIAARFAELKALFGKKSAETLPAASEGAPVAGQLVSDHEPGLEPAAAIPVEPKAGSRERAPPAPRAGTPAPPSAPENGSKGKGWFGLGAVVAALIGGMLVMQFGLEAQGAAMAQLTEDAFGDFSILAQVTIFAQIGSMVGQQLSQFVSSKLGLTKTFYAAHALRAISLGAMVFLLGTGMMPLPLMFVFYAANGVVTGIGATSEGTLRKFLLAQQGVSQQKFRTWWQLLAEIIAVPAPMVLGALVPILGAGWITALYPATILAGLMLFMALKVIPWGAARRIETMVAQTVPQAAEGGQPAPAGSMWQRAKAAFKQILNDMEEGKQYVFKTPILKYSLMGAVIFDLMNLLIYRLIAPGYGKLIAGSAGMAAVQGNIVGMFSLGGLLLAATFLLLEKRAKAKAKAGAGGEAAAERGSMLRWMLWGVPALALLGVMAFNIALPFAPVMFLGVDWMPTTALAAALIPFGFFQVAASIKLNSWFVEKLPADAGKVQKALAFSGSAMTALSIVLMLALKPLFGDIGGFNPFPWLAAALVPVGVALFFLQRKLASATRPDQPAPAPEDPGAKTAGGYVGLLLGVMAAALALTAVPFIPGVGPLVAGLGVLGKFLVHLIAALALPAAGWLVDRRLRRR